MIWAIATVYVSSLECREGSTLGYLTSFILVTCADDGWTEGEASMSAGVIAIRAFFRSERIGDFFRQSSRIKKWTVLRYGKEQCFNIEHTTDTYGDTRGRLW